MGGVLITHENLVAGVASGELLFESVIRHGCPLVFLAFLPLAHIFELMAELSCFQRGGSLCYVMAQHLTAGSCQPHGGLAEFRPTMMIGVPKLWETLISRAKMSLEMATCTKQHLFHVAFKEKLASFPASRRTPLLDALVFKKLRELLGGRLVFMGSGGSALGKSSQEFMMAVFGVTMVQGYGLTETCCCACLQDAFTFGGYGNAGGPTISNEVRLRSCIDDKGEPEVLDRAGMPYLSTDTVGSNQQVVLGRGEVCIRGAVVSKGYYKLPDATRASFRSDGWFHTGDVGQWSADGALQIIDRIKNLLKLKGGEYIAIESMETVYRGSAFVDVLGGGMIVVGDSSLDRPVALVVVNQEALLRWAQESELGGNLALNVLVNSQSARHAVMNSLNALAKPGGLTALERLGDVRLLLEPWTVENGGSTATGKPARHRILEMCRDQVEDMRSCCQ